MICSDHFLECHIKRDGLRTTLTNDAIPSRLTFHVSPTTHDHGFHTKLESSDFSQDSVDPPSLVNVVYENIGEDDQFTREHNIVDEVIEEEMV